MMKPPPAFIRFETIHGDELWLRPSSVISIQAQTFGSAREPEPKLCVRIGLSSGECWRVPGTTEDFGKQLNGWAQ